MNTRLAWWLLPVPVLPVRWRLVDENLDDRPQRSTPIRGQKWGRRWGRRFSSLNYSIKTRVIGGEGGIRTHGARKGTPHFECGAFDHSATSPEAGMGSIGAR